MNDNGSLLNMADPKVRAFIDWAEQSGFVNLEQLNAVLPEGEVTSGQLEATFDALAQMGISVTEE